MSLEDEISYHDQYTDSFKCPDSLDGGQLGFGDPCEWQRCQLQRSVDALEIMGNLKGKKLVDVGCGPGFNSMILANLGADVIGIDVAPKTIDFGKQCAEKLSVNANFQVAEAEKLKEIFPGESIDIVFFNASLHHFKDVRSVIKGAMEILKPGGMIIACEPKSENPAAIIGRKILFDPTPDEHPFKLGELETIIKEEAGNMNAKYYCILSPFHMGFDHWLQMPSLGKLCFCLLDYVDTILFNLPYAQKFSWLELVWCTKMVSS